MKSVTILLLLSRIPSSENQITTQKDNFIKKYNVHGKLLHFLGKTNKIKAKSRTDYHYDPIWNDKNFPKFVTSSQLENGSDGWVPKIFPVSQNINNETDDHYHLYPVYYPGDVGNFTKIYPIMDNFTKTYEKYLTTERFPLYKFYGNKTPKQIMHSEESDYDYDDFVNSKNNEIYHDQETIHSHESPIYHLSPPPAPPPLLSPQIYHHSPPVKYSHHHHETHEPDVKKIGSLIFLKLGMAKIKAFGFLKLLFLLFLKFKLILATLFVKYILFVKAIKYLKALLLPLALLLLSPLALIPLLLLLALVPLLSLLPVPQVTDDNAANNNYRIKNKQGRHQLMNTTNSESILEYIQNFSYTEKCVENLACTIGSYEKAKFWEPSVSKYSNMFRLGTLKKSWFIKIVDAFSFAVKSKSINDRENSCKMKYPCKS